MNLGTAAVILNVDDFAAGRYATTRVLKSASFDVREAATGAEALALVIKEHPDLVLLDVNLPDINGFEVCRRIKADPATARIPVLHISASSQDPANRAMGLDSGADQYLIEPVEPEVLVATVKAALRSRRAEDAMRRLAHEWQTTFNAIGDGLALLDERGRLVRWNRRLEQLLGRDSASLAGEYCNRLWPDSERAPREFPFLRATETRRREDMEVRRGGQWFTITVDPIMDEESGELTGAVYIVSDRTLQKDLEEQFRQAQKFESIGQLAAGVAHDFNNLLTSILGNTSLVLGDLPEEHEARERLDEVVRASNRAAELTRQLLAYSGKARFAMKRVDIGSAIHDTEELLRSSLPKKVRLDMSVGSGLPAVEADPSQIQQMLLTLVINSAEAIGDASGTIRVTAGQRDAQVWLEVSDTGCGMDEHVRAHLFDPFFTTKFTGRGLGLSAVAGIVRAHHGAIEVESAPGAGATFRIFLPALKPVAAVEPLPPPRAAARRTVLVVDDEEMVRRMAKTTLEIRGYRVLVAENGQCAVDMVRENAGDIGAVLLDMAMPVMGGEEALGHIVRLAPGIKVIASTGYGPEEASQRFGDHVSDFLQKPYSSRQLTEKIRALLGKPE